MKLLTVTVPCYNSAGYMKNCIDSLLVGGDRVEIILIDDGSVDETGAIADGYAQAYPDMVKVVHQENGGHGEGINQGLRLATGTYFKVVDSDDRLSDDFPGFLDRLALCEQSGGVDLFVTNYFYTHSDGVGDRSIDYGKVLPEDRIFHWDEIGRFRLHQLLTIHSCTFRTECMRKSGLVLPKHTFYEDNYMVYSPLPLVERLYYMNCDLYRYTIGREGQSVQESVTKKRYAHQLLVTQLCFEAHSLDDISSPKLKRYMKHELYMMFAIATMFSRLNQNDEADADLAGMWEKCIMHNKRMGRYFRYRTTLRWINLPGRVGRKLTLFVYRFANTIVRFN